MDMMERIELLIKKTGKSKNTVSKECGLNYTALYEWKKGKAKPSVEALIKIANYFGVSSDYLLCISDNPYDGNDKKASKLLDPLEVEKAELLESFEKLHRSNQIRLLGYLRGLLEAECPQIGCCKEFSDI